MSHPSYKHIGYPSTRLIEECSELIQALCKADRFGLENYHPDSFLSNSDCIQNEITDVLSAIEEYQLSLLV
jgi:NTP pyrophosphatase (non-canonical NTP hydrolase)